MLKQLAPLLKRAKKDKDIVAVMLFGSAARGEKYRDIDVALVLRAGIDSGSMFDKRLDYLGEFSNLDIQIFNQLPLYIRQRILKEGKILLQNDTDALYDIAFDTIRAYEDFKSIYEGYLEAIENQYATA
ncbi:Uncharacterised protein [uncultured archaeon]|nr:Uncharacterised protein [uncultured archaeon]